MGVLRSVGHEEADAAAVARCVSAWRRSSVAWPIHTILNTKANDQKYTIKVIFSPLKWFLVSF